MKILSKMAASASAGVIIALGLVSCTGVETFPEADAAEIPEVVTSEVGQPVGDTGKLLGRDSSGTAYYFGRWSDSGEDEYCLVIVKPEDFSKTCQSSLPITAVLTGTRATLSASVDANSLADGAEQVGPYLVAETD